MVRSAADRSAPSLAFELDSVEGGLEEMDVAVVGVDNELAVAPGRILVSTDQQCQGELMHHKIPEHVEIVIVQNAEGGAWIGDVLSEKFV